MANSLFTNSFPPSREFSFLSRVRWAILGNGRGKFQPNGQNYLPFSKGVILIDTSPGSLMDVAMSIPHLNTVISTGAELFSLMEVKHLDKKGEPIKNSPVLKFLRKPNPLQMLEQYLYEFYVLNAVYNKTFQHMLRGLSANLQPVPSAMWILPSGWMKINTTGKIYRQTDIKEIIENYEMLGTRSTSEIFDVEQVIYMSEGLGNNILNPISRIEAQQIPLSNIVASLKSRNIIVTERGMIGFIKRTNPTGSEQLPPDKPEIERWRKEYQKQYHLDSQNGHVSITSEDMVWVPMTYNIKELGLLEGVEDDFSQIIAAFRHGRDMYPSVKGATYENQVNAIKYTITKGLQPLADKLMRQFTKHFINEASGEKLEACYEHIPEMKEDERLAAQGKLYMAQATDVLLKNGTIGHDQVALLCGVESDGTKEIMQSSAPAYGNQNQPANGNTNS